MQIYKIPAAAKIMFGMFLGIAIGTYYQQVFFGIDQLATSFIMLLQMTAIPYITLSLIVSIGGLRPDSAGKAVKFTLTVLFLFLTLILFFVLLVPISFPDWQSASFYSASTIKPAPDVDFLQLLIPKNPFNAYANAIVPAIVFFSILLGISLMRIKGKHHALFALDRLQQAMASMNSMVMRLAPLGVFAIALRAAATIDGSQIDGLKVYIGSVIVIVLLIGFIVLPVIVASITPFTYQQIMRTSRSAMITAFATGSVLSVLPSIIEESKALIADLKSPHKDAEQAPSIIIPIAYSLPVGGKLLALVFVLFSAWFTGTTILITDYFQLIFAGIPQLFGSTVAAMPMLLELFNVDSSMFDLYLIAENMIVSRLGALLTISFSSCFALIVSAFIAKSLKFNWRYGLRNSLILSLLSIIALYSLRLGFEQISHQYEGYSKFIDRDFIITKVKTTYLDAPAANAETPAAFSNALNRISKRGFLRVGYFRDDLPYSFHNKDGKLVGFDIELLSQLAKDMHVDVQFVKIYRNEAESLLKSGYLDITTGFPLIPENMQKFTLTAPYTEQAMAFVVKSEQRANYTDWEKILQQKDLTVGIPETFFYRQQIVRYFNKVDVWEIATPRLFFKEKYEELDAMLFGAPAASAWTLLYPQYSVVVPKPIQSHVLMSFPINHNDYSFELFMRNWIDMKKQQQYIDTLFKYWIEGKHNSLVQKPTETEQLY